MTGKSFEWKLEGHIWNDNAIGAHKLSLFVRLKTLAASGIFWLLFFAVEKESLVRRYSRQKPSRTMARSVFLNFYTELKHALALTALHGFFQTASRAAAACRTIHFLPAAAKSAAHRLCSSSNYL
jgi:hypothetical protein